MNEDIYCCQAYSVAAKMYSEYAAICNYTFIHRCILTWSRNNNYHDILLYNGSTVELCKLPIYVSNNMHTRLNRSYAESMQQHINSTLALRLLIGNMNMNQTDFVNKYIDQKLLSIIYCCILIWWWECFSLMKPLSQVHHIGVYRRLWYNIITHTEYLILIIWEDHLYYQYKPFYILSFCRVSCNYLSTD